ncbi:MAG: hypothetical protein JWQ09_3829 [Segetibacter sp.]|nr:hypothetical protein [Segetibacter sp.]
MREVVNRKSQAKTCDFRPYDFRSKRGSKLIFYVLFSSCLYFNFNCHSTPKTMETRGTVKGLLHDQSGKPVSDAIVMIVSGSSEFNDIASVSNDNGEFKLSNVVIPGNYVLQIQNNGQQKRKEVDLQNKDSIINITF